ncbi:DUF1800 family protein [Arenicella xantha]|nr:DUF1800 family protein [Arenicella xantha]
MLAPKRVGWSSVYLSIRWLKTTVLVLIIMLMLVATLPASAQLNHAERQKITAVMSVINLYLLDQVSSYQLTLGQLESSSVSISSDFEATFDAQAHDIEVCFILQRSGAFNPGNFSFSINGVPQLADNQATLGENCYLLPVNQQLATNTLLFAVNPGTTVRLSRVGIEPAVQTRLGLQRLTRSGWDEQAVRKVLKIFAFGGHASDAQILEWSYMRPRVAITQMLNFNEHNQRLSPMSRGETYTETAHSHGTLRGFFDYIGSSTSNIPIPVEQREYLSIDGYRFDSTFSRMIAMRGLNPFRQRIGFWETNYHLATNLDAGVSRRQMVQYYDEIMQAHEARLPYHEVMGVAAKSAAVAMQYGHRRNQWVQRDGEWVCECNDDFAREIHQLFYGIFGASDPHHEDGTIRETAKMLTDMRVPYIDTFGFDISVSFEQERHHLDDLTILGTTITGSDASAKIDNLMPVSIMHPESLFNLPVTIISDLADDNLNEARRDQIRAAWAALGPNKDFLTFIHIYATSNLFHSPDQFKYLTSFERAFYTANKFNIDNIEAFFSNDYYNGLDGNAGREVDGVLEGDNSNEVFRPLHNVFGGQTSQEASDSAVAFEKNYNRSATPEEWQFRNQLPIECETCDQGLAWQKDWTKIIPPVNGGYSADYVARWLWMHAVGSFDNYTELERAHLLAILGANRLANTTPGEDPEYYWQIGQRYPFFDINFLLCIREDRRENGISNNSLADIMSFQSWNNYCLFNYDGEPNYAEHERQAFELSFSGDELQNSNQDPFPYLRGLMAELAVAPVALTSSDAIQKRRANERVQAAIAFIFATPYVFAEGQ